MSKQFNPFHRWLGFDETVTRPNHFQLFGVKTTLEDPIGFGKQVHSRAKKMLAKLESMSEEEIGTRTTLHTNLRKHIVKAHDILLDDKLRARYQKTLREKSRQEKSSKPLLTPPPSNSNSKSLSSSNLKLDPESVRPVKPAKPKTDADQKTSSVPMAIPVSSSKSATKLATASTNVNFDNLASEEIRVRPARIKRKRSWLVPILCLILTITCIAGIVSLVTNFDNKLGLKVTLDDNANQDSNSRNGNAGPLSHSELNAADSTGPTREMTTEEIRRATEKLVNEKKADEEANAEKMASPESKNEVLTDTEENSNGLSLGQLHTVKFCFVRARNELRRGRIDQAESIYQDMASMLNDKQFPDDQVAVVDELECGIEMVGLLRGFWRQVKSSSQRITGGELEPEPGVLIGFVEGRENDVVLRFGENVMIPYQSLRPGLAVLLAEKKTAKNVPAWRLQKAAFRVVHGNSADDPLTKQLLESAEADDYDTTAIRNFSDFDSVSTFPAATMTAVDRATRERQRKLLVGAKYSAIDQLSPADAKLYASAFSTTRYDDPVTRIVALEECIRLSRHAADAFLMVDLIDELHRWTQIDSASMKQDGFRSLSQARPQGRAARVFGEAFFEFLKSADASQIEPVEMNSLKQQALEIVSAAKLDDLRRLISQTMD